MKVYYDRGMLVFIGVLGLFLGLSAIRAMVAGEVEERSEFMVYGYLVFGLIGLDHLWRARFKSPVLTIDDAGLHYAGSKLGLIPWEAIVGIHFEKKGTLATMVFALGRNVGRTTKFIVVFQSVVSEDSPWYGKPLPDGPLVISDFYPWSPEDDVIWKYLKEIAETHGVRVSMTVV